MLQIGIYSAHVLKMAYIKKNTCGLSLVLVYVIVSVHENWRWSSFTTLTWNLCLGWYCCYYIRQKEGGNKNLVSQSSSSIKVKVVLVVVSVVVVIITNNKIHIVIEWFLFFMRQTGGLGD